MGVANGYVLYFMVEKREWKWYNKKTSLDPDVSVIKYFAEKKNKRRYS